MSGGTYADSERVSVSRSLPVAASLVVAALALTGVPSPAAGSPRAVAAAVAVPEPGVTGCDVLLTAPAGHTACCPGRTTPSR